MGIENLSNISEGGCGTSGIAGPLHHMYNDTLLSFTHNNGTVFLGTAHSFYTEFGLNQASVSTLISGRIKSHLGWRLSHTSRDDLVRRPEDIWNYDSQIRTFYHVNGEVFTGTQNQFRRRFGLTQSHVSLLVRGRLNVCRGWHVDPKKIGMTKHGKNNPSYKNTEFTFHHKDGGKFTGTQYDFGKKFSLDFRGVSGIVTGRTKTHMGWSVKEV